MLGAPIIAALQRRGIGPRVLSSSETSAARLRALGVADVIIGDFRSDADLDWLLAGAASVLHIPPSVAPDEDAIGLSMVAAAERAGVEHFAFMSCFHALIPELRHHMNKLVVEQALTRTSLRYTVLQPAMFMQNLGFIWPKVQGTGEFAWPWDPDQRYTMVDVADIAEASAAILADPKFIGGTYELCAGDELTVTEMAAMLGAAMGRTIRAGRQEADTWSDGMRAAGAPSWSIETVAGMCDYHDRHGYAGGSSFVLEAILGRKPTGYAEFARRWVQEHA